MTSQEYTQWLKGFLDAVDNYSITKKQFDAIREKLKEVDDTTHNIGVPIGTPGTPYWGGWGTTTPYSIPLSGTITTGGTITTSNYPSGSTVTYTTGNGNGGAYSLTGNTTTTSAVFVNQSSEDDEKLLLD
jgi:hypothetical protein